MCAELLNLSSSATNMRWASLFPPPFPASAQVGAGVSAKSLRLRLAVAGKVAAIVGSVRFSFRVNAPYVVLMHRLAAFCELEEVAGEDLLRARLVRASATRLR